MNTYATFAETFSELANSPKDLRVLRAALLPEFRSAYSQADANSNVSLELLKRAFC